VLRKKSGTVRRGRKKLVRRMGIQKEAKIKLVLGYRKKIGGSGERELPQRTIVAKERESASSFRSNKMASPSSAKETC